ncbi:hypothetical protein ACSS7Z_09170 [Microbacterium sp. A82]|uniref:hypothetical protein n=1 Tax=Microbacterium sp. A82 TaxID=3450452 RepID=UPI003F397EC2
MPFLIGDAIKVAAMAALLPAIWRVVDRARGSGALSRGSVATNFQQPVTQARSAFRSMLGSCDDGFVLPTLSSLHEQEN